MRVTIIALVLAVGLAANATMSEGQQDNQKLGGCNLRCRHLRFIGEGSVPVKPKWALLDLSVEVNSLQLQGGSSNNSGGSSGGSGGDKTAMAKQVRDEAQHRSAFILNYLKDLKMEDIKDFQTQEMSFVPMYDDDRNLIGYKATFGLSFKVALDKLQEVLDHIVSESGANRLNSIVFVADEDDEKQANIKAIELATQNAWDQAQAITKVFGIQGNLKLLSVREKIQPLKRIIRRIAARRLMDSDMGGMDDNDDDNEGGDFSMLKLLKGDTIVNARLVFNFDFEDGTISFQQVQPIESNFTVADTFGGLLKGGANETNKQPQQPGETQAVQPANNATAPNITAAQPGVTQPVQPGVTQPGVTQPPAQPQPQPT